MKSLIDTINEGLARWKNREAKVLDIAGADKKYWDMLNKDEQDAVKIFVRALTVLCTTHDTNKGNTSGDGEKIAKDILNKTIQMNDWME